MEALNVVGLIEVVPHLPRIYGEFRKLRDTIAAEKPDLAILTAHYGVILASVEALLNTQHFGGAQYFVIENHRLDIVIHTVDDGYYAMLAVPPPAPLGCAIGALRQAALELRKEMR